MLSPYRVVDCTDHRGHLAGFLLAQLGADIVLVEPPEGSSARRHGPYAGDRPGPERSLWHWAYNRGKRSVVVDRATPDGRHQFRRLLADADILLWSGPAAEAPGTYEELARDNPGLIVVAYTPFGLDGPKAAWSDADLTVCAAGGQLALTGDTDRPPLRCAAPQGYAHGAGDMAAAALMALNERARSGRGQLADVSAQVSYLQASFAYMLNEAWHNAPMGRSGEGVNVGPFKLRWGYPAADGEVTVTLLFGAAFKVFTPNLFRWIWEEGGCDEATRDKPWEELTLRLLSGEEPVSELNRLADVIAAFTSTRTKAELVAEALRRRVLLAPVSTLSEVVDLEHLAVRGFFDEVRQPAADRSYRHPGRFVVASGTPLRTLGPAPRLGEHTEAVLADLPELPEPAEASDLSGAASSAAAGTACGEANGSRPLTGLKVLDLTWSIAGPYVSRSLADFGATVVKVETQQRVDVTRTVMPLHPLNAEHPLEGGGLFANSNAGKLGIELDLRVPAACEVVWDLVRWADVVLESFSAGALDRMGFGYERLRALNPGVILLSSCLPGQTGPLQLPGYGNLSSAVFGFHHATRWPDRQAAGPFGAYTDVVSPRFSLTGLLAALDHRRRTGEGQHLDISQGEASLHFLSPALLDVEVNDREPRVFGNADAEMAPHGVYPSRGDDRWVAVVCPDDQTWRRLAVELGRADLAALGADERLARRDEIDDLVASWTAGRDAGAVEAQLQACGVPAHQVANTHECLTDPQLAHRGHFVDVEHPLLGTVTLEGPRYRLSRTPGRVTAPGPTYGQHTWEVLSDLLGYDDDRIAKLAEAEVFG